VVDVGPAANALIVAKGGAAYQFVPNSYTFGALNQIELVLVRLAEIES
jgi:hypothetical protein